MMNSNELPNENIPENAADDCKQRRIVGMTDDLRRLMETAITPGETESTTIEEKLFQNAQRRIQKLRARIESGDIQEILGFDFVARCYQSDPIIEKKDVRNNQAIVLSAPEIVALGTFDHYDAEGGCWQIEPESVLPGMVYIVFPEELGSINKKYVDGEVGFGFN